MRSTPPSPGLGETTFEEYFSKQEFEAEMLHRLCNPIMITDLLLLNLVSGTQRLWFPSRKLPAESSKQLLRIVSWHRLWSELQAPIPSKNEIQRVSKTFRVRGVSKLIPSV